MIPGYQCGQQQHDATEFLNGLMWKIHDHVATQRYEKHWSNDALLGVCVIELIYTSSQTS